MKKREEKEILRTVRAVEGLQVLLTKTNFTGSVL
jgi:hypothetical protein